MNFRAHSLVIAAVAAFAAPAFAHHSFSMFDAEKTVTLTGTVKEFEWSNPHCWLRVMVVDHATGKPVQYVLEMGSPQRSAYDGWKKDSARPGDAITVTMHPLKDGARGGMYLSADLPNGKSFGRTGPAVGLPTPPTR